MIDCDLDKCKLTLFNYDKAGQNYVYGKALKVVKGTAYFNLIPEKDFLKTKDIQHELNKLDIKVKKSTPLLVEFIAKIIYTFVFDKVILPTEYSITATKCLSYIVYYRDLCDIELLDSQRTVQRIIPFNPRAIIKWASNCSASIESGEKSQLVVFRETVVLKIRNKLEYFDEEYRLAAMETLKTMEEPERLSAGIISAYLSVQRFEIIKQYVIEKLSVEERTEFPGTWTIDDFLHEFKGMWSTGVYTYENFRKNLLPLSDATKIKTDFENAKTIRAKTDLFVAQVVAAREAMDLFDNKYDAETLLMTYRYPHFDALMELGGRLISLSPSLGSTDLPLVCAKTDFLSFAKSQQDKHMGRDLLDSFLAHRILLMDEAKQRDIDIDGANSKRTKPDNDELAVISHKRVTVTVPLVLDKSPDSEAINMVISKENLTFLYSDTEVVRVLCRAEIKVMKEYKDEEFAIQAQRMRKDKKLILSRLT